MPALTCPDCGGTQEVDIAPDTYVVMCERCGEQFDIPRKHRINKRELQEYKSRVNIRVGFRKSDDTLNVGWTVQSAEKGNQFMEKNTVSVDVSKHSQKTYWYVAIFKMLQHVDKYKSARIWIKHDQVLDHLSGETNISGDDLRSHLTEKIGGMCDEKFLGCEFAKTDRVGHDIERMIS